MKSALAHYCQKCRAANQLGERHCRACGTRLMLVVFPPSIRHDEAIVPTFYEDHLLERVSLLELQLAQAMEKIGMISAFFAREAKELKRGQKFVRAFAEALKEANPQTAEILKETIEQNAPNETIAEDNIDGARMPIADEILLHHDKPNRQLFAHLLGEAMRLLEAREEKQAFQMLERAALLSAQNVPLIVFTAENYYRAEKFKESKKHLERAFELAPDREKTLLLLGAIYADAGDAENARKLLSVLANDRSVSLLVHFIWGMLAAFEKHWTEALAAFKQAADASDEPEINYLIGCVYFQLGRFDQALRYLQKTAAADFKFSDAWLMQSLIYKLRGETGIEANLLETAASASGADADDFESLTAAAEDSDERTAPPFRHFKRARKNILTGGLPGLNRFFRERVLAAVE